MNGQPRRARHDDSGDAALLDLPALASLVDGHCGNPFALLGPHADPDGKHTTIRAYLPRAERVEGMARHDDTQLAEMSTPQDRKHVGEGRRVSGRDNLGGGRE